MHTGVLAEFRTPEEMLRAIAALRERGYRLLDAFSPFPVHGEEQALGLSRSRINWMIFPIAAAGAGFGYLVQWFCNAYDYPLDVGGRPPNSAPTFIPITFETAVLTASIAGVVLLLILCRLPLLYTPLFDVEGFERASVDTSVDTFWVGVDDGDPQFDEVELGRTLRDLGARTVARARRRPR
jgi:hypothetical protein